MANPWVAAVAVGVRRADFWAECPALETAASNAEFPEGILDLAGAPYGPQASSARVILLPYRRIKRHDRYQAKDD